jgi:hypothetical protein
VKKRPLHIRIFVENVAILLWKMITKRKKYTGIKGVGFTKYNQSIWNYNRQESFDRAKMNLHGQNTNFNQTNICCEKQPKL